jgi:putative DNA methylase
MPLASSFELSKKKGKEAYVQPVIKGNVITYTVKYGKDAPPPPKTGRGKFKCICCNSALPDDYTKIEGKANRIGATLIAIVAEGKHGRLYLLPNDEHQTIANCSAPEWKPEGSIPSRLTGGSCVPYGMNEWYKLFTNRQLTALTTFSDLVAEAQAQVERDGGSREYAQAVAVYLAFAVDKLADNNSSVVSWNITRDGLRNTFGRQAIPMVWDFAEANPFSDSTGCFTNGCDWAVYFLKALSTDISGIALQHDAQTDNGLRSIMISTDPPYYDNIAYADLSDFFYVWLRKMLKETYSKVFRTMLVPKTEELVAMPYRFDGNMERAKDFFEDGMLKAFKQVFIYARDDIPVTIYYAFKQSESDEEGENIQTASTGWETMLSAVIKAGFSITGTLPMRTERSSRTIGIGANALASSIILVCRKRSTDAPTTTRRDFINALKRELKPALQKLQASNIAPVDLAQSAIGPGMGVYSNFSKVLEADGTPMSVRSALQIINQELDLYFTEQDSELDRDSRFCVDLYSQYAFNDVKFGEADVLARAKNTSVEKLRVAGILYSEKGVVRLLTRKEISDKASRSGERIIWLLAQQLTRAMEKDGVVGVAKIVADIFTSEPEHAKALAYRLFQIAERKGWAGEAYAYNSLVIAWPEVQSKAAEMTAQWNKGEQGKLEFV